MDFEHFWDTFFPAGFPISPNSREFPGCFEIPLLFSFLLFHLFPAFSCDKQSIQSVFLHKPHKYQEAALVIPYHPLFLEHLLGFSEVL